MKLKRLTVFGSGSAGCRAWIGLMITCMCSNLNLIRIANYSLSLRIQIIFRNIVVLGHARRLADLHIRIYLVVALRVVAHDLVWQTYTSYIQM